MSDGITATMTGIGDYTQALLSIPTKLRRRALLNALKKGARVVQAEAQSRTPVLRTDFQSPYRKPGTVKNAIAVRTSKIAKRSGDVGVFVNVKPLPGAKFKTVRSTGFFGNKQKRRVLVKASQRSAKNPNDPFYWQFINFDHVSKAGNHIPGSHFLEAGAAKLPQALAVIEQDLGPQIQRLDTNPSDPL